MFVFHGPVKPDSPAYVAPRPALDRITGWLDRPGCVGVILGARQTGKTTLCISLRHKLGQKYRFAYIDLQNSTATSWDECARDIAARLRDQLCAPDASGAGISGAAPQLPAQAAHLPAFFKAVAQRHRAVRIAVIFEELGGLPDNNRQRLGQVIRALFTNRLTEPIYERYTFIIAGAHELHNVANTHNSPLWNVADKLYLDDFSAAQVELLVRSALSMADDGAAQRMGAFIHDWTGGHPYWTQRLGSELQQRVLPGDGRFCQPQQAAEVAAALVHSEDTNLPHVLGLINNHQPSLWDTLDAACAGNLPFSRFNPHVAALELIGAVSNRHGRGVIRNRIYEQAICAHLQQRKSSAQTGNKPQHNHNAPPTPEKGPPVSAAQPVPKAFISYTHDSPDHRQRILALAQQLRADGIDCTIDQFVNGSPPEGWPLWMERQVAGADFVLIACSATYARRYAAQENPGTGLGGTWEAVLTRQELYEGQGTNRKFVPILFADNDPSTIPTPLRPYTYYSLPARYEDLLRYLTGQPDVIPEPLGTPKKLPPTS